MNELRERSAARITTNEKFSEIKEQLAEFAEEDDVIHLAELIREREEKEAETKDAQDGKTETGAKEESDAGAGASTDPGESSDSGPDSGAAAADPEAKDYDSADSEDEEKEPSPQRQEALRILADLVELQETARSSWHAPQSASRSVSPSSRP
jgi:hypothetical protein